jgi:quercetin dioxygenase-like cupin family protein
VYLDVVSLHIIVQRKERAMQAVDLTMLALREHFDGLRVAFPVSSATGTAATATVYMEFEPGAELPEHRDSAEEILVGLEGVVEAFVGDEQAVLAEGQMAVVPATAPHGLRNASDRPARVLGVFGSATNVATFSDPHEPDGWQIAVIGAPVPLRAPLEEAVTLTA